jgi:NOL1/NOP2/fmu family ribosome biogenesis protein
MCEQHDLESIRIDVPSEWGIAEVEKEGVTGYQFLPYQIKGEGFFISILKKKNEKANEKEKPHNTKINMLSKKEKIAVDEWLNDEGQELSILKSPNDAIYLATNQAAELFNTLANKVRVMLTGIKIGKLNKNLFLPDHGLAMSNLVNSDIPKIALEKEEALDYLRKKLYQVEDENKGWVIITYQDSQLGWIKNLGNRINNYLPNEFMIRNL